MIIEKNNIILKTYNTTYNTIKYKDFINEIYKKYKLNKHQYYLINLDTYTIIRTKQQFNNAYNSSNPKNIELKPRINGGNIFKKVFGKIFKAIFKVFDPIIKPLRAIADAVMGLIRMVIYMGMLIIWMIKFMTWFLTDFLFSIPLDIITLSKRIVYLVFDAITSIFKAIIYKLGNNFGNMTLSGLMGADNVPDNSINESTDGEFFQKTAYETKCYRTSDGLVPFSVIIATILCPPVGVFMEYGLFGWFNILICALLTLAFYFPGLIYALILLYC
jgi:uncharacterized membrane protein YqaE (UPF0057 family)